MPLPLPWKKPKPKPNRISRIVADLQPSSRVVQTGFPTSVVDLFVKNRNRMKKHKHKHHHSPVHFSADSVAPPPTPSLSPENSPCLPVARVDDEEEEEDLEHDDSTPADVDSNVRENGNANRNVFVSAAKIFLAVIPALNSKKLALGITLSAFLLFLLQIWGKFAIRFFWTTTTTERRRDGVVIDHGGEEPPIESSALDSEIQMAESNSEHEHEELGLDEGLGLLQQRESIPDREKNQRSRSARLRAKIIKKLIPKKLRSGKRSLKRNKMKEEEEAAGIIMIMENEQTSCEELEDQEIIWEPEELEEEEIEDDDDDEMKNLECKIMMLMILLGLFGGRFVALVLTVSGCFVFKFIQFLVKATPLLH